MKKKLLILSLCLLPLASLMQQVCASDVRVMEQQRVNEPTVEGGVGRLTLIAGSAAADFTIYTITGQVLRVVRVMAGERTTIEVPKGFYIVKSAGRRSLKVVVR